MRNSFTNGGYRRTPEGHAQDWRCWELHCDQFLVEHRTSTSNSEKPVLIISHSKFYFRNMKCFQVSSYFLLCAVNKYYSGNEAMKKHFCKMKYFMFIGFRMNSINFETLLTELYNSLCTQFQNSILPRSYQNPLNAFISTYLSSWLLEISYLHSWLWAIWAANVQ